MTMTFTKDKDHPFSRIYERLRKRSWRKKADLGEVFYDVFDHTAYVKGVHDALKEVDRKRT